MVPSHAAEPQHIKGQWTRLTATTTELLDSEYSQTAVHAGCWHDIPDLWSSFKCRWVTKQEQRCMSLEYVTVSSVAVAETAMALDLLLGFGCLGDAGWSAGDQSGALPLTKPHTGAPFACNAWLITRVRAQPQVPEQVRGLLPWHAVRAAENACADPPAHGRAHDNTDGRAAADAAAHRSPDARADLRADAAAEARDLPARLR